jgi:sulfatase modifying factor 1
MTNVGGAISIGGRTATGGGTSTGGTVTTGGTSTGGMGTGGTMTTGGTSTGGTSGASGCPGTGGPTMVRLPEGYCIDSTEVTRGQYQAWLDTQPSILGQNQTICAWNTIFVPDTTCMSVTYVYLGTGSENHPQGCVDWCDAYAYCRAVGKRLCGRIGGGSNGITDYANASLSQWYNACVSDGANNTFPYGGTYSANACDGGDHSGTTVPVGSMTSCQSAVPGYQGVYDLSGNVWEWEDSCNGTWQSATCRIRGGTFYDVGTYNVALRCDYDGYTNKDYVDSTIGFRCCS